MKKILIARAELSTRMAASKGDEPTRQIIPAGTHLTKALLDKHGLKPSDVEALVARGHIVERLAHVVTEAGDSPTALEVAAAEQRATDAEGKVADLEKALKDAHAIEDLRDAKIVELEKQVTDLTAQLAEATKPAAPAKA